MKKKMSDQKLIRSIGMRPILVWREFSLGYVDIHMLIIQIPFKWLKFRRDACETREPRVYSNA